MLKNYKKDKLLDSTIIDTQNALGVFERVLTDYLNHGMHDPNHLVLKDRDRVEFECEFQSHITQLRKQIEMIGKCLSPKDYSKDHLAAHVFLDEIKCNEYFIYNSRVITICFKDYCDQIISLLRNCSDEGFYSHPLIKGRLAFLNELLYDISEFFERLYVLKSNYYKKAVADGIIDSAEILFIIGNRPRSHKRDRFLAQEIYQNIRNSMDRYCYYDWICDVPTAMFQIRQSIELRLWEIFGIHWILDKKGNPVKVTADSLMELDGLERNVDLHIKLSNLRLIHNWANIYVHAGITEKYWQIYFAAECIKDFIFKDAIANDQYYSDLKSLLESTLCKDGWKIDWRKRMACISESEIKQREEFDRQMNQRLK